MCPRNCSTELHTLTVFRDSEFTDPVSGCVVTMAEGSGISWSLTFSWNWIAANNWTSSGTNN